MDRTERFYLIDQMLNSRRVVTRQQFLDTLEISLATFKRDLEYLRDRLGAPIVWDRDQAGYRYQSSHENPDTSFQLPGIWFNPGELQALLTMHTWLENLQPGILSDHIRPLQSRIRALLDQGDHGVDEITRRIRIITQARRSSAQQPLRQGIFELIAQALLNRKRLMIRHYNRALDQQTERQVSPQRLTFYRDNWYLDAWCHLRRGIRSFAVDALQQVDIEAQDAREVDDNQLDRELGSGYGIFSGAQTEWAELRFSPQRARWVAQEQWHPLQQGEYDADGYFLLRVPYSRSTELVMDVLRHGTDVEVLSPGDLRKQVASIVNELAQRYQA